jgi:ribosomal protein L13E
MLVAPTRWFCAAARAEKAKAVFPRPVAGPLRPVVRGQTLKYNTKTRLGRGFTHEELKVGPAENAAGTGAYPRSKGCWRTAL